MKRIAFVIPAVIAGVAGWRLFGSFRGWVGPVHVVVSALLAATAVAMPLLVRRARLSIALATGLLAAQLGIIVTTLAGVHWTRVTLFGDARVACAVGAALAIACVGLVRTRLWGRWLAVALGAVSIVSSGINAMAYWKVTAHPDPAIQLWSVTIYEQAWVFWVSVLGGALTVALLAPAAVRERFLQRAAGSTWTSGDRLVGLLRVTLIAAFAAIPMLLVYAWLQPIVPATRTSALVLAAALAVAGVLAVRGRVVGALLLVLAGVGLLAQAAVTGVEASDRSIALYYAVFWVPAGLLALACGARLAGPTLRLLRRPPE